MIVMKRQLLGSSRPELLPVICVISSLSLAPAPDSGHILACPPCHRLVIPAPRFHLLMSTRVARNGNPAPTSVTIRRDWAHPRYLSSYCRPPAVLCCVFDAPLPAGCVFVYTVSACPSHTACRPVYV
ncbi:hypothetical protein GDO78_022980 [Eleutherodactylus coqui]|uniref:Uncharacterized protein n=1 Tax=Eleutherodactylus coqui TaxID=57060 RepID=A0A8J6EG31_ELECQ|nr:hypothetical protein GDO78_022980 [Eleutherodactylus coqui]